MVRKGPTDWREDEETPTGESPVTNRDHKEVYYATIFCFAVNTILFLIYNAIQDHQIRELREEMIAVKAHASLLKDKP